VRVKGLLCQHCGEPAADEIFSLESLAMCTFCIKHLCNMCNKPHPKVKIHDGINRKHDFEKRRRCPDCAVCISCGTAAVPDRYENRHEREIRSLSVHISVREGMNWLVDHNCEECLLDNPHWKLLMENPLNLTYRLPKDFKTGK
jgi:hypothetical protein